MDECRLEICHCRTQPVMIDEIYMEMWGADTVLTLEEEKALEPLMRVLRSFDKLQGNP